MRRVLPLALLAPLLLLGAATPAPADLSTISIAGPPRLRRIARDVLDIRMEMSPDLAAAAGLYEDAARVPSFAPEHVSELIGRLEADLRAMQRLRADGWSLDERTDLRWIYAVALEGRRRLAVEKTWQRRPAEWLEPVANDQIALISYAPERLDLRAAITAQLPAMLAEMRALVTRPTARDVTVAIGMLDGIATAIQQEPESDGRDAALHAIADSRAYYAGLHDLPDYAVIGADDYAWRLRHALLLPWDPDQLLALAEGELARVEAEIAALEPRLEPLPAPEDADRAAAAALDQAALLALYDGEVEHNLERLRAAHVLTVPPTLGPIHARPTPDAMIPLTGDGGSMNPPAVFGSSNVGWWNVEHLGPDWTDDDRLQTVLRFRYPDLYGLGTYAVHEGVPGHHLQLSIARENADPLRSVLQDNVPVEGWGVYAEQLFWEGGGFGDSVRAHVNMLRSWKFRIRRVIYDVHVETGSWTLQQAADYKYGAQPGQGKIDEDLLRSINWPTQLICYFAGKMQILALRDAVRAREGASWDGVAFHDRLLAEGSIPLVFASAGMLGAPLPALEPESEW